MSNFNMFAGTAPSTGLVLLDEVSGSALSLVSLTGLTGYDNYRIAFTSSVNWLRLSTDNGSTFDSGAVYRHGGWQGSDTVVRSASTNDAFYLSANLISTSFGVIDCMGFGLSGYYPNLHSLCYGNVNVQKRACVYRGSTEPVNAVQFWSSGAVDGAFWVYGWNNS